MNIIAVVVTLDRPETTLRCLSSILQGTQPPDRVVIVDNGSTIPYTPPQEYRQYVEVVRLDHNSGPAGGAAAGQQKALELKADWVWMVDDDAIANLDALATLTRSAEVHDERTYFRSVCYNMPEPELPFFNSFVYSRRTGMLKPVPREQYQESEFPFDTCAMAGLFVPSSLLLEVGLFDASLYGWYDDTEFTLRATLAGFHGYAIPASRLLHPSANRRQLRFFGRSLAVLIDQPWRLYYGTRNCILTQRHLLGKTRFMALFLPLFSVRRFISIVLLYNNRRAFLHSFVRGVSDGLRGRKGELTQGGRTT
jgi:rhamnopyranosyl-N-acetylglucosaminyl-diphospho-decaprenol beta-1,3/1,4-galactofuranosyltransferase